MFCDQCGTKLKEGIAFCPNCGKRISDEALQVVEEARKKADTDIQESAETAVCDGEQGQEEATAETVAEIQNGQAEPGNTEEPGNAEETIQNAPKRFCPNCGTENQMEDGFCKECGMPLGSMNSGPAGGGLAVQMSPVDAQRSKKTKKTVFVIGAVAAVLLVVVIFVTTIGSLLQGPRGKVLKATAATMKDAPKLVTDLAAISEMLSGEHYTAGLELEGEDAAVRTEFRCAKNEKQLYFNADVDDYGALEVLCGIHSGKLKLALSELDYVFFYDPKGENDGILCKQVRKKTLEEFNQFLEGTASGKVSAKTLRKDLAAAWVKELKELEFKEVKAHEFEVDKKDRECKGYRIRITEDNIVNILEYVGEKTEEYQDVLDELCDEIKDEDFNLDITFYIYKGKLAAVVFDVDDEKIFVEFQGGDYRMQNILLRNEYRGRESGEITVSTTVKGGKETIEIEGDGREEMTIVYDTKSGELTWEYDDGREDFLLSGIYKHSNSEVSFVLEELEADGHSLLDDIGLTMYVRKKVDIEQYEGKEFDLGSAEEEDLDDLEDDMREYIELLDEYSRIGRRIGL